MKGRRGLWLSLAAIALLMIAGRALAGAYADYRWFASLGASEIWSLQYASGALLRTLAFAVGSAFAFANLWGVRHSVVSLVLPRQLGNLEIGEEVPGGALMAAVATASVVMGMAFAALASDWQGFELALRGISFGENVPHYNVDVGFFVYWLPFERSVYAWVACVVSIVSIVVVVLYALTPSLRLQRGHLHISTYVRRHVALLAGVAIALLAWSFRLDAYEAVTHGSGPDGAFGAFDHKLRVPIATVLSYVAIGCGFVVAWAGWNGQSRIAFAVVTVLLLLAPTLQYALPLAVRWSSAPASPEIRERPYAANRAGFTRRAFGLERVETLTPREFSALADASVTSAWDPLPLAVAIERTRHRGPVMEIASLVASAQGPVFVSIEQPAANDPRGAGGWSVIRSLAAITDQRGNLVRVDRNGRFPLDDESLPPVLVYEGAREPLVISDVNPPPAAPMIESFGARLAEALSQQNLRLLSSPPPGSRMMRRRDVRERVRAMLPFFSQGTRIVPLIHGDSLLWAVELYSTTDEYPLSRRVGALDGEINYLRHAGTALVHAYTGRVTVVPDDDPDPIARTWIRRLPNLLGRANGVSPSLLAQLPPDVDGAEVQAEALAAVGLRSEEGVRRRLPMLDGSDTGATSHAPTYIWLPASATPAWTIPLLDERDRVTGVLVATGGPKRSLRWFRAPASEMNWQTLLERMPPAAESIEPGRDSRLIGGRIRVLPLADSTLIALQPFYEHAGSEAPTVAAVVVAHADSIRVGMSMSSATGAPDVSGPVPATPDARQERMRALYAEMRAALQRGDWQRFGEAFEALGALLERR